MSGANNISGEGQGNIHHILIAKEKVAPLPKKISYLSKKVTQSNEVEKGTNILNDMEDPVVMIHKTDLDKFQGQPAG